MARAYRPQDDDKREEAKEQTPQPAPGMADVLALQQSAGNAAVSRMLASGNGGATLARWTDLGEESWKIPTFTKREMRVFTGTKSEWSGILDNLDDEDEYEARLWGFLEVANDPGIVGRKQPPPLISDDAAKVQYVNTVKRVPNEAEKLAFLEALYEKAGDLDLWHGGTWEGGPFVGYADKDLAQFISDNQSLYLIAVSNAGHAVGGEGVKAVSDQGGKAATMAMITNAGATAHKGVDLVMSANQKEGQARETAHSQAMELIRNSGRTIRHALEAHDDRVTFQQDVVGAVFDHVWDLVPGGGLITSAGKAALKFGLGRALKEAQKDDGPKDQAENINSEFVATCNGLVQSGSIKSADAQDAINGFEAVRR